jgi:hypothetical protein
VQHQVGKYVVQEVLREGDVVLGELEDERTFCDLANALLVALEKAVLQLLQSPELQVRGLSEVGPDAVLVLQKLMRQLVCFEVKLIVVVSLQVHHWAAGRHTFQVEYLLFRFFIVLF